MNQTINNEKLIEIISKKLKEKGLDNIISKDIISKAVIEKLNNIGNLNNTGILDEVEDNTPSISADTNNINIVVPKQEEQEKIESPIINPESKFIAEVPEFLKDKNPEKIIIFKEQDILISGEELSSKPFLMFDDPDKKESIKNFWQKEGILKTEVYKAEFKKIGEIEYDYKTGISKFNSNSLSTEENINKTEYQKNPYSEISKPEIVENEVKNLIFDILKDYFSNKH